jgi:alcohol dehydrogenase class IV
MGGGVLENFVYSNPIKLLFGPGQLAQVGEAAKLYGRKALIVTSGSSGRTGLLDRVISFVTSAGMDYAIYDKVLANPLLSMVEEAVVMLKAEHCDVIIGVGGGSAMDTAKGAAFAAVNEGNLVDYVFGKPGVGALPLVLVTTTAGTGSEGNSIAVFTNPANNDKKGLKSPFIYPKVAIVDPELLTTLPVRNIAASGMDALFHAIEAFTSRQHQLYSDMLALRAIELLGRYLPVVYNAPENIEAWEQVAFANTLGGMAIDAAGTALPHAMEHPLSGLLNVVHGEGLAAVYPAIMEFSYLAAPARYAAIAKVLGTDISGMSEEAAAAKSIDALSSLLDRVNLNICLRDFGVKETHLDWLVGNVFKTMKVALANNPRIPTAAEVRELYQKSL